MEFRLLGETAVIAANGTPLDIGPRKQRVVLGALILKAGQTTSHDQLIDMLWAEPADRRVALSSVHAYVSKLRRILEPAMTRRGPYEILARRPDGYRLSIRPEAVDVGRVRILAREGRRLLTAGETVRAAAELRRALAEWRGEPFGDLPDRPWIRVEAHYLSELRLALLEDAAEAELAQGMGAVLGPELGRTLVAFPFRERLRALAAHALYQAGRQTDALTLLAEGRRELAEGFGLDPDPRIRVMEERILRHDPALTPRQSVARASTCPVSTRAPSPVSSPVSSPASPPVRPPIRPAFWRATPFPRAQARTRSPRTRSNRSL
jgi:DNA-binding SARP family transcriptional activator